MSMRVTHKMLVERSIANLQTGLSGLGAAQDSVSGASMGGLTDANRQVLATEATALRDSLIGQANATHVGRPIFGGTGIEAFGSGGPDDLFVVLADIADAMVNDPDALTAQLDGQLSAAVVASGLDTGTLTTTLGEVVSVDLPRASIELALAEVAYQGALSVAARVIQPSLASFLR